MNKQPQLLFTILPYSSSASKWNEIKLKPKNGILPRGRDCSSWSPGPGNLGTRAGLRRCQTQAGLGLAAAGGTATAQGVLLPSSLLFPIPKAAVQDTSLEGDEAPEQLPQNLLINSAHTQHKQTTSSVAGFIWSYGCH